MGNHDDLRALLYARLTSLVASTLDLDETLERIVALPVPEFAAWVSLDLMEGGQLQRKAVRTIEEPGYEGILNRLRSAPPGQASIRALETSLRLGEPLLVSRVSDEFIEATARDEEHKALLRALQPVSTIFAPLRARGETLGLLIFVSIRGRRTYDVSDSVLAADIAQRSALAVHNAQLYQRLQAELAERNRLGEELERSELAYRLLFESNPHPMWVFDRETLKFLAVNDATIDRYGFSREEFMAMTLHDIRPPDQRPLLARALDESAPGFRFTGVFTHWRKDRSTLRVEVSSHDVTFRDHRARLVLAEDVTERERALEALQASEERYRLVSRATKEAVWDWDIASNRLAWNPTGFEVYGIPAEEVAETLEWRESRIHPDDLERTRMIVANALAAREEVVSCDYRFRRGDGVYAHVSDRIVIAYRDGRATRAIGSMADVTLERRLNEQLAAAQRMEAVGRLAGGLAHDLNNVLTAIGGFAGLIGDSLETHHPARADVHQIVVASERAADLIRQLMAYSRQQVLQPQVIDVNTLLSNLQRMLERVLGEDIEVRLALHAAIDPILVDPGQLEQVLLNLVVNARDAMPSGGQLRIETANVHLDEEYAAAHPPTAVGDYVLLAVTDTGIGMDAETQARIFEPFFTTKERGRGTGLGLATTYGIVRQSGGHIWVYSEPGNGTTFKVFFPRTKQAQAPERDRAPADQAIAGNETILLVEDDPRVRRVASRGLEHFGYRVVEAGSAEEALQVYADHAREVAMVVSDVVLPRMSGPDLIHWLRKLRPSIRVLFMSGYSEDAVAHHGRLDPGAELLEKPFSTETLVRRVRAILDRRVP